MVNPLAMLARTLCCRVETVVAWGNVISRLDLSFAKLSGIVIAMGKPLNGNMKYSAEQDSTKG
jgi:hypothetical protein